MQKARKKSRKLKLAEGSEDMGFGLKPSNGEVGSSGTDLIGGMYREEFLLDLQGPQAADAYEKMKRRESQVTMLLNAIKNPIISGNWSFEIEDESDPTQVKMKELCEWNFNYGLQEGMKQHIREALSLIDKGFCVFEAVHGVANPRRLKGQQVTYYQKFGFRKQNSIYRWGLEKKTGKLLYVEQTAYGDVPEHSIVKIPGEHLLVFTNQKEGDNYEGVSALRAMYGAYSRKDLYIKLTAVGVERFAIGTVVGTVPKSKAKTEEDAAFEAVLEAYSSNECSFIKIPEGWKVEIQRGEFDPSKMVNLLNFENEEMAKAVVANFLLLGSGGNAGALSLGTDLSDFFLGGIQSYADLICEGHNRNSIPALCKLNYGEQDSYPVMKCTGINDKAGKELADIVLALKNAQGLTPDSKLEDFLRAQYRLPKQDPATARKAVVIDPLTGQPVKPDPNDPSAPAAPGGEDDEEEAEGDKPEAEDKVAATAKKLSERTANRVLFADQYRKQLEKNSEAMKEIMVAHARVFVDDLKKQLASNWEGLGEDAKASATKDVAVKNSLRNLYKKDLREILAGIATQAIAQARKEVPKAAKKIKFFDYDKLNPIVRKAIEAQLGLLADTQVADIEKVVLFQWSSSASSRTNVAGILEDVEERIKPILEGTQSGGLALDVAAGNATSTITQNSRNAFFFEPEVLETLESFTFVNEDPVSEICTNLNGQTFSVSDPAAEAFYPPLHHLCKSRLVPNEKGEGVKVTGIAITADTVEERQRLEKQITFCGC